MHPSTDGEPHCSGGDYSHGYILSLTIFPGQEPFSKSARQRLRQTRGERQTHPRGTTAHVQSRALEKKKKKKIIANYFKRLTDQSFIT